VQRFYYLKPLTKNTQMSLKKLLILPVGFLLSNFLYISCCKCVDVKNHFYEVRNASVLAAGSGGAVVDNGIPITVDTVFLNYYLSINCIAEAKTDFSFLVNGAYACKCSECGDLGLKNKLTSIEITSDNTFNGIAPNTSLNSFFKLKGDNITPDNPVDSLVMMVNQLRSIRSGFSIFTKTKPGNTAGHKFMLTMVYANNTTVTSISKPIIWQ
jgi:hypothetical protein